MLAERRLCDAQARGGALKRPGLDDRDEIAQLPDVQPTRL
jgi:hypothetical protein